MAQTPALARPIGLVHATAMVVGIIIGASIFVQPSEINRHVPSVSGVLLVWVAAGLLTLASYLLVYTPLKRRSSICVFVGAAAGAMPPVIGYVAASGHLAWGALALFSILFVWQIPHVYAIAVMYRDDYDRGGLKMLPAASRHGGNPGRHIVAWSALLIPASAGPTMFGISGVSAALGGVVLALLFLHQGARFLVEPTTQRAREVLVASVVYLPLVLLMTLIGR